MRRIKDRRSLWIALAVLAVLALSGSPAQAGFLASLRSITPQADGTYRWDYDINVDENTTIKQGDYFTIYDFNGLISGSNMQPPNWLFSSPLSGPVAPSTTPQDNPAIMNLSWMYEGSTPIVGPVVIWKDFTVISQYGGQILADFGSVTHRSDNGRAVSNVSSIEVAAATAPEPTALTLLGIGVPLLGVWKVLHRRASAA